MLGIQTARHAKTASCMSIPGLSKFPHYSDTNRTARMCALDDVKS